MATEKAGIRREMMGDEERPQLGIALEKLCFLIAKAREYDALLPQGEGTGSGSNFVDEREVGILEDGPDNSTRQELADALESLNDDEKVNLLALVWLGRGDYEADDWTEALQQAAEVHDRREADDLLGLPLLGSLLDEGAGKLGYSCEEVDDDQRM